MRRRLTCALLCAAALLAGCTAHHHGPPATSTPAPPASPTPSATTTPPPFPGPSGMQARWVIEENRRPGSTGWQLASRRGAAIAGYAGTTAAVTGDHVRLYVDTAAPRFQVEAYRMGYYGGAGARLVWRSGEHAGHRQPRCPRTPHVNMVACHWRASLSVAITPDWPEGDYLLKLVAEPGRQSYVPLTIWNPASKATYVIDNSVFTWQAWNDYGGYDMYGGGGGPGVAPTYEQRARVMSYDRPYGNGSGAGDFLGIELPLVRFAEQHGLDVTYWTDITFHEHPNLILNHRVYLSLGHAECWSNPQRAAAVSAIKHGVNFVFFAASPILRHVRLQPGATGTPDREMVDYRDPDADPIRRTHPEQATGNTWAVPPTNAPPSEITGDSYGGYNIDAPLVVADVSAWPFRGTGLRNGAELAHLVRYDFDGYDGSSDNPPSVQILAHSPIQTNDAMDWAHYADMVYHSDRASHAGVLATGTNAWIEGLSDCPPATRAGCPARYVRAITANILRVFGAGPAGLTHPSVANWRKFPQ